MLSIRVSPKPLSTGVIYQGQSEAALSTSSRLQWSKLLDRVAEGWARVRSAFGDG